MTDTASQRIFVVDDDDAIIDALAEVLSDEGYQVDVARNGKDALALLRAAPALPDVILLDLTMPVMDGWEFRNHQLADPVLARIPTLVLTAGAIDSRLADLAATGCLRKPIQLESLLALLRSCCAEPAIPGG